MAKIIEKSKDDIVNVDFVKEFLKDWEFRVRYTSTSFSFWANKYEDTVYTLSDIEKIEEFDADEYRSAGGAAAGAIIGGLLTGGLGLIAGAAIGGRRKKTASFVVAFNDGIVIAFHEDGNAAVKTLREFIAKERIKGSLTKSEIPARKSTPNRDRPNANVKIKKTRICPHCDRPIHDGASKCFECGATIGWHRVDTAGGVSAPTPFVSRLPEPPKVEEPPKVAAEQNEEKVCPDCAETIKAAAKVCRYCGYRFEGVETD